jgi:hypothetical protein
MVMLAMSEAMTSSLVKDSTYQRVLKDSKDDSDLDELKEKVTMTTRGRARKSRVRPDTSRSQRGRGCPLRPPLMAGPSPGSGGG